VREAIRQLSVELSQQTGRTLPQLCHWLEGELTHRLQVEFVIVRLMTDDGRDSLTGQELPDESVLQASLRVCEKAFLDRSRMTDRCLFDILQRRGILLAFRVQYAAVQGLVLIGDRRRGDRLADEQLSSLVMLFDQWAATVHGRQLEERRVSAERRAMQQEKLSVLGLLAGSLAHELRNPLSSIRTIAVLLLEDLGAEHPRARDVEVIVAEIDRLTQTTQRLLDSARPADSVIPQCSPDTVVIRLMHILGHFARQHHVDVELSLTAGESLVSASDATLSEILFNLIRNAVEAARERAGGRVRIRSCCEDGAIVITVADNGAGVAASMTESLFQPFVTARPDGTGLGLFVAAERVRELQGKLGHRREENTWTVFEVRLPAGPGAGVRQPTCR
jgi:signal transduction histidine kinase